MTLKQIESELRRVNAAIQDLYWTFTRTKRGKPPAMVAPHLYTRRSELEAERSRILRAKRAR